jgi:hypothetical protein
VALSVSEDGVPLPRARCQALTRRGEPCKNLALADGPFCRVHEAAQSG